MYTGLEESEAGIRAIATIRSRFGGGDFQLVRDSLVQELWLQTAFDPHAVDEERRRRLHAQSMACMNPRGSSPAINGERTGSVSWFRQRGSNLTAATAAVGRNVRPFSTVRALPFEFTRHAGRTSVYGRFKALTVETEILTLPPNRAPASSRRAYSSSQETHRGRDS